jgi:hypothetical protein
MQSHGNPPAGIIDDVIPAMDGGAGAMDGVPDCKSM